MTLEPGQRVRCVDNEHGYGPVLLIGAEYRIDEDRGTHVSIVERRHYEFMRSRFKPVVRVKMGRAVA